MDIVFATAELSPFVKVGGLGDAAAGLVGELRLQGADVEVVIPDYGLIDVDPVDSEVIEVPAWAAPATARRADLPGFGPVVMVRTPGIERPHPYVDRDGEGWPDNEARFFSFSAAVASLAAASRPDILHLNDWHTAPALGLIEDPPPSVLTIHNLAYQGVTDRSWLSRLPRRSDAYEWYGGTNALTGGIALADKVVAVSPTFAAESRRPGGGFGAHDALAARGDDYIGILNGIDTDVWDPSSDPYLKVHYDVETSSLKRQVGREVLAEHDLVVGSGPLTAMVTRLTEQKGVDLALRAFDLIGGESALIILGAGDRSLAREARLRAESDPGRFAFIEGYDEALAHRLFAGADLFLMPSRFEPAGLAQMQAMRYGTIPVVTDVGGLHDTVIDDDLDRGSGTGFVSPETVAEAVASTWDRAITAWRSTQRRGAIRRRGMSHDWSWRRPALRYLETYETLMSGG